ncbi:hypothetical protein QVD17_01155 [Tagetes erecta]|uniref:Uncharacterized protein n=1 Tax=Tagetes erecta TaxID=13708 RepID=A0AAD8P6I5_TARER|nr:hypothetical protein QVD17_01155 [Tagetes erecta]
MSRYSLTVRSHMCEGVLGMRSRSDPTTFDLLRPSGKLRRKNNDNQLIHHHIYPLTLHCFLHHLSLFLSNTIRVSFFFFFIKILNC